MVYAALVTPVMVGGAGLSVDVSRMYNLDQQLQSAADAYARAGASELDGRSDAITRANRAIDNLVKNGQSYAGKTDVTIAQRRFLKQLPANDYDDVPAAYVTTDPAQARYVELSVDPVTINTLFPAKLSGAIASVDLSAKATSGFEFGTCGTAPVFVCNPYEGQNVNLFQALESEAERRRQIRFINPGGACDTFAPGAFGYLDPFSKKGISGANKIKDAVAVDKPPTCFQSSGVHLRPGKISSMRHAVNVRFDMYEGRYKQSTYRHDPAYAPAANVVKGYTPKRRRNGSVDVCKPVQNSQAQAMPRDNCFYKGTCTDLHGMMGDGNWDFLTYMKTNHNYMRAITIAGTTYHLNYYSKTVSPSTPPSRYDMYRWEIDNNCVPGALTYGNSARTPEEGLPQCHSTGAYEGDVDRRIIQVAVLNCEELSQTYNLTGGATPPLPAQAFIDVFLTEPMGTGYYNSLYGEMVGVVKGSSPLARDTVAMAR